ncbi:MAG: hypothetical protein LBD69_01960 [Puniceicoccales bacterium]|jgi:hypothetical protein|nr:hypothetical protein [Puniceicoccales bacterium]
MTSSTSAVGLQGSEIQAATSVACPELPALSSACNKLIDLICTVLSKIPLPGSGLLAFGVQKLVTSNVLHLKEHMLNALSTSHKEFSEICKNFSKAKGVKEFFKALGNMFQWAIGKGFYGLSFACTKMLGWLIALNDATIGKESIRKYLTNLKQDFETAVTFEIGKTAVILSAEQKQTNEHQVTVTEDAGPILQPTTSLAEKSDATHDVKTHEQRTLEIIQQVLLPNADIEQLLADNGIRNVIQQLDTDADMVTHLLSLLNLTSLPERLLTIIANSKVPQSA